MQDFVLSVAASIVAAVLFPMFIIILNKFTTKVVNAQVKLFRRDWVGHFIVAALSNLTVYLLFAYCFAVIYKWNGWVMGNGPIYGVIIAGVTSPLINFITFMFWSPRKWGEAALVGVVSLSFTYSYMGFSIALYSIVFHLMERLPGV